MPHVLSPPIDIRVIIKLFGPMSQNCYQEVSHYFGIKTVKELIRTRFEKFIMSYS